MAIRGQFAQARIRSFLEASDAYVARIADDRNGETRGARAEQLRRSVLRQLSTDERRQLIYRFARFVVLAQRAGLDVLELCVDPPVFEREVRLYFSAVPRGWISAEKALHDPGEPDGHQVYLGAIPELACFGFILLEVASTVLIPWIAPIEAGVTTPEPDRLTSTLASVISELGTASGLTDHHARILFRLIKRLEATAGDDFSLTDLSDDQVLAAWQSCDDGTPARFIELLRQLSALAAEIDAAHSGSAMRSSISLDAPAFSDRLIADHWQASTAITDALSDPLLIALLSRDDLQLLTQQLDGLAHLIGLHRSRARAITFGPLENRIIQAKREQRDLLAVVNGARPDATHAGTLKLMGDIAAKLDSFVRAGVLLQWDDGDRTAALRTAVHAGYLTSGQAVAEAGLVDLTTVEFESRVESALAGATPSAALEALLDAGRSAWKQLRRRKAFSDIANWETKDALDDALVHAGTLSAVVNRLRESIGRAVADCAGSQAAAVEYNTFCAGLGRVHGFDYMIRETV